MRKPAATSEKDHAPSTPKNRLTRQAGARRVGFVAALGVVLFVESAASLDLGVNNVGISFGNSKNWTGLRFNYKDNDVKRINGLSVTLWSPRQNLSDSMSTINGVLLGLHGFRARHTNGIMVGAFRHKTIRFRGICAAGVVVDASPRIYSARDRGASFGLGGIVLSGLLIDSGPLSGIAAAGVGISATSIHGVVVSGLGLVGGDVHGVVASGLLLGAGDLVGIAAAGVGLGTNDMLGVALGGLGVSVHDFLGVAAGGAALGGSVLQGICAAGLVSSAFESRGFVISGAYSKLHTAQGLVTSGAYAWSESLRGVALSPVNRVTGTASGIQIGIVNYARSLRGLQIGIVNVVAQNTGLRRVLPIINWGF